MNKLKAPCSLKEHQFHLVKMANNRGQIDNTVLLYFSELIYVFRRASRRSMMPEMFQGMVTAVSETIGCRLTPSKGNATAAIEEQQEEEMEVEKEVSQISRETTKLSKTRPFSVCFVIGPHLGLLLGAKRPDNETLYKQFIFAR